MIKLEEYLRLCSQNSLIKKQIFKKSNQPRFSIIAPILNKALTLQRYTRSIQNQSFKNLEIIFIDDHSSDNSITKIEDLQKEDERIILLKNKKRKGTLIARNIGVFKSKGEFLLFVDPDDIISENLLKHLYIITKKYDFDLIRFNLYIGNYKLILPEIVYFLKNKPSYKPNIFRQLFFGFGQLLQIDYFITNKLIKRKLFIRALNSIKKYFLNQFMIDCEDGLVNFMLYKLSESLFFTRKIGYYYIVSKESITNDSVGFKNRLKSNFLYFNFIIKYTKNNNIEKQIANYIFSTIYNRHNDDIIKLLKNLDEDSIFYIKTINLFINNEFIPLNTKLILKKLKNVIIYKTTFI